MGLDNLLRITADARALLRGQHTIDDHAEPALFHGSPAADGLRIYGYFSTCSVDRMAAIFTFVVLVGMIFGITFEACRTSCRC